MKIQIKLNEEFENCPNGKSYVKDIDPKVVFQMDEVDKRTYNTDVLANYTAIVELLTYDYLALARFVMDADIDASADIENPD